MNAQLVFTDVTWMVIVSTSMAPMDVPATMVIVEMASLVQVGYRAMSPFRLGDKWHHFENRVILDITCSCVVIISQSSHESTRYNISFVAT